MLTQTYSEDSLVKIIDCQRCNISYSYLDLTWVGIVSSSFLKTCEGGAIFGIAKLGCYELNERGPMV